MKRKHSAEKNRLAISFSFVICFICAVVHGELRLSVTSSGEIFAGGPVASEAQQAFENRIKEQSEGKIKLISFKPTKTKFTDVELDDRIFCEMEFQSEVQVLDQCFWVINYHDRPLTFKTFPSSRSNTANKSVRERAIQVERSGDKFTFSGSIWFRPATNIWTVAGFASTSDPEPSGDVASQTCVNNLRQLGVSFLLWSVENGDQYQFNVSTNKGGTLELCNRDKAGFDANAIAHFRLLSDTLGTPGVLVCPADLSKKSASGFPQLQSANISYRLRTGREVNERNLNEALAVCPLHKHVLKADGSVEASQE